MKYVKALLTYALTLIALILLALGLLYIAGRAPQTRIADNLRASLYQFEADEASPQPSDIYRWSDRIDAYSEQLMCIHAFYMDTGADPASIVSNPGYLREDFSTYLGTKTILDAPTEPNFFYQRYWMGFRAYLRVLLCLFTYPQLRRIHMVLTLLMFSLALLKLSRRTRGSLLWPMLLALSFVLCNPIVILETFHSGTCFVIAFFGVACLPTRERRFLSWPMYFFLLGALTQYLDFYTSPLITCLMPLTALLLIRMENDEAFSARSAFALAGKCLLGWFAAYSLMWVGKMAATTLLTDYNAFADAFGSLAFRLGLDEARATSGLPYSPVVALARCFGKLILDNAVVTLAVLAAVTLAWLIAFLRRGGRKRRLLSGLVFLCLALLPLIWIAVSAQPSIIHARFQYRTLAAFVFAYTAFLAVTLRSAPRAHDGA